MTDNTRWGATPEEWVLFVKTLGLREYILPVVCNPKATLSPGSKISKLGKMPSSYNRQGLVSGFSDWQHKIPTSDELRQWSRHPDYGICVRSYNVNAFDVDVEDDDLSANIRTFLDEELHLPIRYRANSNKFLMPFKITDSNNKRILKCQHGMIEWLATGQQFLVAGSHPSEVRYKWEWLGEPFIPTIPYEQLENVWAELEKEFGTEPSVTVGAARLDRIEDIKDTDRIYSFLNDQGMILAQESDGRVHMVCPFREEHTTDGGAAATTYFPANTGGFEEPAIHCLHAHCSKRTTQDFLLKLGIHPDFEDLTIPNDLEFAQNENSDTPDVVKPKTRFVLTNAQPYASTDYIPSWLIKGVLPKLQVGTVIGPPSCGKTFMVLDMAYSVARGTTWRGFKSKQGGVAYLAVEGKDGIKARLKAYQIKNEIHDEDPPPMYITPQAINLARFNQVKELVEAINEIGGIILVVIDTLSSATPGANENSAEDMSLIMAHCRFINEQTGATVLLVHHTGKDVSRGARGSSAILGQADFEMIVNREGDKRSITVSKQRDAKDSEEFGFKLEMVPIGMDDDDMIVESCIIQHSNELPKKLPKEPKALEKKVVASINKITKGGDAFPDRNHLLEYMEKEYPEKTRGNSNRAINSAIKKGVVVEKEGLICIVDPRDR